MAGRAFSLVGPGLQYPRSIAKRDQCFILGWIPRMECYRRRDVIGLDQSVSGQAAVVLAALYMLCILAPAAAFAFSASPGVAHCLTEGHVGMHDHGNVHVHADATAHHHD